MLTYHVECWNCELVAKLVLPMGALVEANQGFQIGVTCSCKKCGAQRLLTLSKTRVQTFMLTEEVPRSEQTRED